MRCVGLSASVEQMHEEHFRAAAGKPQLGIPKTLGISNNLCTFAFHVYPNDGFGCKRRNTKTAHEVFDFEQRLRPGMGKHGHACLSAFRRQPVFSLMFLLL